MLNDVTSQYKESARTGSDDHLLAKSPSLVRAPPTHQRPPLSVYWIASSPPPTDPSPELAATAAIDGRSSTGIRRDGAEASGAGGHQLPRHGGGAEGLPQRRGPHAALPRRPLRLRRGGHPRPRRRRPVHAAAHGGQHPARAGAARRRRPTWGLPLLPLQRPRLAAAGRDRRRGRRRHRLRRVHRALRHEPDQRPRFHGARAESSRWLPVHHGVRLVPGGLIDKTKEQIGNSTKQSKIQRRDRELRPAPAPGTCSCASLLQIVLRNLPRRHRGGQRIGSRGRDAGEDPPPKQAELPATAARAGIKNRSLPLSTFVDMLRDRTGKDDVCVGSIRTTLFHHFGDDASPKIRRLVRAMLRHKHGGGGGGGVGSGATAGEEHQDNAKPERDGEGEATKQDAPAARASPRNGVLISGCQTDETSADATTPEGVSYGALSNAIQNVLAAVHRGKVINMELVRRTRELLAKQGYTQQPGLYCSDKHANVAFIC